MSGHRPGRRLAGTAREPRPRYGLLVPQRKHGVEACRPTRRDVACRHGDDEQGQPYQQRGSRCHGAQTQESARDRSTHQKHPGEANAKPYGREQQPLANHQRQNVAAACPHGHPHPDLVGPPGHRERDHAVNAYLEQFATVIRRWYATLRGDALPDSTPRRWALKTFTDSMVLAHPICWPGESGEPEFGHVVSDIALLQLGLANDGFFVRGGVAAGDLYIDDEIVFGVGLLDAYEAERQADVPRVVLASSAVALVERHLRYYASAEAAPQNDSLLVDADNHLFVNYLDSCWLDRTEPPMVEWLGAHRDVVAERLNRHQSERRVWAKYAWVARYHNYICTSMPGAGAQVLDESLSALEPRRLQDVTTGERPNRRLQLTAAAD